MIDIDTKHRVYSLRREIAVLVGNLLSLAMSPDVRARLPQHEQRSRQHALPSELERRRARLPLDVSRSAGTDEPHYGGTVDRHVRRHRTLRAHESRTHVDDDTL